MALINQFSIISGTQEVTNITLKCHLLDRNVPTLRAYTHQRERIPGTNRMITLSREPDFQEINLNVAVLGSDYSECLQNAMAIASLLSDDVLIKFCDMPFYFKVTLASCSTQRRIGPGHIQFEILLLARSPYKFKSAPVYDGQKGAISLINQGDADADTQIIITGACSNIHINDFSFAGSISDSLMLDSEFLTAIGAGGTDLYHLTTGDFIKLGPGQNNLSITCDGSPNIKISYHHTFK